MGLIDLGSNRIFVGDEGIKIVQLHLGRLRKQKTFEFASQLGR